VEDLPVSLSDCGGFSASPPEELATPEREETWCSRRPWQWGLPLGRSLFLLVALIQITRGGSSNAAFLPIGIVFLIIAVVVAKKNSGSSSPPPRK
jgi:hypothetical protein